MTKPPPDDILISFVPKISQGPRGSRYMMTFNLTPSVAAKMTVSTPFRQPFLEMTWVCEDPLSRASIVEVCENRVTVSASASVPCLMAVCLKAEDQEGVFAKNAVWGSSSQQ